MTVAPFLRVLLLLLLSLLLVSAVRVEESATKAAKKGSKIATGFIVEETGGIQDGQLKSTLQQLRAELSGSDAEPQSGDDAPAQLPGREDQEERRAEEVEDAAAPEANPVELKKLQGQVGEGLEREQKLTEQLRSSEASSAWLAGQLHNVTKDVEKTKHQDAEDRAAALRLEDRLQRSTKEKVSLEKQGDKLKQREKWLAGVVKKMLLADGELQRRTEKLRADYKALQNQNGEMAETNAGLSRDMREKETDVAAEEVEVKKAEGAKATTAQSLSLKEAELEKANKKAAALEEENAKLRAALEQSKDAEATDQKAVADLQGKSKTLEQEAQSLTTARDEETKKYSSLKKGMCLSVAKKLSEATNDRIAARKAFDAAKKQNEGLRQQNGAYKAAVAKTKKQLASMMKRSGDMGARMKSEIGVLHRELQERENEEAMRSQQLAQGAVEKVQRRVNEVATAEEQEAAEDGSDDDQDDSEPQAQPQRQQEEQRAPAESNLSERLSENSQEALNQALTLAEDDGVSDDREHQQGFLPRRRRIQELTSSEDQDGDDE